MTYLERLETLNPDVVDNFLRTGTSTVIPAELQNIIRQMSYAVEIYQNERNLTRAARKLVSRTQAEQGVHLDISTAKSRIYAALNYFSIDCNVSERVWLMDAADKMEDLAKYAVAKGRLDVAERCYNRALEHRLKATAIDKEASLNVVYLLSDELTPEDLGFTTRSKKDIARRVNSGYYAELIGRLNVSDREKDRLLADADIQILEVHAENYEEQ